MLARLRAAAHRTLWPITRKRKSCSVLSAIPQSCAKPSPQRLQAVPRLAKCCTHRPCNCRNSMGCPPRLSPSQRTFRRSMERGAGPSSSDLGAFMSRTPPKNASPKRNCLKRWTFTRAWRRSFSPPDGAAHEHGPRHCWLRKDGAADRAARARIRIRGGREKRRAFGHTEKTCGGDARERLQPRGVLELESCGRTSRHA